MLPFLLGYLLATFQTALAFIQYLRQDQAFDSAAELLAQMRSIGGRDFKPENKPPQPINSSEDELCSPPHSPMKGKQRRHSTTAHMQHTVIEPFPLSNVSGIAPSSSASFGELNNSLTPPREELFHDSLLEDVNISGSYHGSQCVQRYRMVASGLREDSTETETPVEVKEEESTTSESKDFDELASDSSRLVGVENIEEQENKSPSSGLRVESVVQKGSRKKNREHTDGEDVVMEVLVIEEKTETGAEIGESVDEKMSAEKEVWVAEALVENQLPKVMGVGDRAEDDSNSLENSTAEIEHAHELSDSVGEPYPSPETV